MKIRRAVNLVASVLAIGFIAYGVCIIVYQLERPEDWDQGPPADDPRLYLPFMAVTMTPVLVYWWYVSRQDRKRKRRMQKIREGYAALKDLKGDELLQRLQQLEAEYNSLVRPLL